MQFNQTFAITFTTCLFITINNVIVDITINNVIVDITINNVIVDLQLLTAVPPQLDQITNGPESKLRNTAIELLGRLVVCI